MIRYLGVVASIVAVSVQLMFANYSYGGDAYVLYGSRSGPMESGRYTSCSRISTYILWYVQAQDPDNVYVYIFPSLGTPRELWTELASIESQFCNPRDCAFKIGVGGKIGRTEHHYSVSGRFERSDLYNLHLCRTQDGNRWLHLDTDESMLGTQLARRYPDKCVSYHYRGDHTNHCIAEFPLIAVP